MEGMVTTDILLGMDTSDMIMTIPIGIIITTAIIIGMTVIDNKPHIHSHKGRSLLSGFSEDSGVAPFIPMETELNDMKEKVRDNKESSVVLSTYKHEDQAYQYLHLCKYLNELPEISKDEIVSSEPGAVSEI